MHRWPISLCAVLAVLASGCAATSTLVAPGPTAVPTTAAPTSTPAEPPVVEQQESVGEPALLRVGVSTVPPFDPALASVVRPADMLVVDLLYDGLTEWDNESGGWQPRLATELVQAADGMSWTVLLDDVTFSNGAPVLAADVVRTFDRLREQEFSLATTRLDIVDDFVALDDTTVRIELSEPFALLPDLLSSPVYGVVPAGSLDGEVGSGPMVAVGPTQLRPRDGLALGFTGVDLVEAGSDAALQDLADDGAIDMFYASPDHLGEVELALAAAVEVHYVLNVGSPKLRDREVREAVVKAVGRTAVSEAGFGDSAIAMDTLVPDVLTCAEPCAGGRDPVDLDIGELSVAYVEDPSGREARMAEALRAQLAKQGIQAVARGYDLETFVERVASGADDLIRVGWVGLFPSPDSRLAPYQSRSSDNVSAFALEEFDALLAKARASGTQADYADARTFLAQQSVVIPIARLQVRVVAAANVTNLSVRHDGTFDVARLRVVKPAE